jgi:hypothetical protein
LLQPMENTVAVRNVLVLHLAERPKQLPGSSTVAALAIYVRHDLLLPLNMTDVSLGFSKVLQLNRAVHATPNAKVMTRKSGIRSRPKVQK